MKSLLEEISGLSAERIHEAIMRARAEELHARLVSAATQDVNRDCEPPKLFNCATEYIRQS